MNAERRFQRKGSFPPRPSPWRCTRSSGPRVIEMVIEIFFFLPVCLFVPVWRSLGEGLTFPSLGRSRPPRTYRNKLALIVSQPSLSFSHPDRIQIARSTRLRTIYPKLLTARPSILQSLPVFLSPETQHSTPFPIGRGSRTYAFCNKQKRRSR